jgi:hypothetical protein
VDAREKGMICPRCFGKHVEMDAGAIAPCPECGGLGEIHCCDGLQEQKDENHRVSESTEETRED